MIINFAKNEDEARKIFNTIKSVAKRNIDGLELELLGFIVRDSVVSRSIKNRTLFSDEAPNTLPSTGLKAATSNLLYAMEQKVLDGGNDHSFVGFFKRLAEKF